MSGINKDELNAYRALHHVDEDDLRTLLEDLTHVRVNGHEVSAAAWDVSLQNEGRSLELSASNGLAPEIVESFTNARSEVGGQWFDMYQIATRETAKYPGALDDDNLLLALSYVGLGLTNEAGEVAGKLKKVIRDNECFVSDDRRAAMIDELGDVLWYLARFADELGVTLSEVATVNLRKLRGRLERGTISGDGDVR